MVESVCLPCQRANAVAEQDPSLDPIEQFEENRAEEHLSGRLLALIDYVSDEELTDSIGRPVCICEPVRSEDRVVRPRPRHASEAPVKDLLPLEGKPPVHVEDRRGLDGCSV